MMHQSWIDDDPEDRLRRLCEEWCRETLPPGYWFSSRERQVIDEEDDIAVWRTVFCFFRREDWMLFRMRWD